MSEQPISVTTPLNLRRFLHQPKQGLDAVPFIDILLIGLFFALFNSEFILPPGINIDLPAADGDEVAGVPVAAVVTVLPPAPNAADSMGMVLFRGDIFRQQDLIPALNAYRRSLSVEQPILLVKMDRRSSIAQLTAIADAARQSGFAGVQIAAEEQAPEPDEFPQ